MTTTTRTWTHTGEQLFDADRANREGHCHAADQEAVAAAIDQLSWVDVEPGSTVELPFTPGHAIKTMIAELGLAAVRRIAWNGTVPVRDDVECAPSLYGLYGIEAAERGGYVRVYVVDRGVDLLVTAFDRTFAGAPASAPAVGK